MSVCRSIPEAPRGLRSTGVDVLNSSVRDIPFLFRDIDADILSAEGDHIKITASKYPFPTVCSISQSTDWFQSIGRTLKWNERERQKSFVVVEETPVKKRHRRRTSSTSATSADVKKAEEVTLVDEEEDEATEGEGEEEEEEKFDIDDLSSTESSKGSPDKTSPESSEQTFGGLPTGISRAKAAEVAHDTEKELQLREAARALVKGSPLLKKHGRSRSKSSGLRSGVETPDRFHGPHPHPPRLSPRHVQFAHQDPLSASSSSASLAPSAMDRDHTIRSGEHGARDDLYSPRGTLGARSRIPRDREVEERDTLRTPTASEGPASRRRKSRERAAQTTFDGDTHPRRAFAVWGHDESDSAASDSDY